MAVFRRGLGRHEFDKRAAEQAEPAKRFRRGVHASIDGLVLGHDNSCGHGNRSSRGLGSFGRAGGIGRGRPRSPGRRH